MPRFSKLLNPDEFSNETVDQRTIDEKTFPKDNPRNTLIDSTLGQAVKAFDPYNQQSDLLNFLKMSQADVNDASAVWNDERLIEEMLDPNSPRSQAMLDMAMMSPAMGMTRTVKEMIKKFGPEVGEIIGKELERKASNIYGSAHVDPYLDKAITQAGVMQRHFSNTDPEEMMLQAQKALGGGRLAPSIEHIGDLPYTMTGTRSAGDISLADVAVRRPFDLDRSISKVKGGYGLPNLIEKDYGSLGKGWHPLREHAENIQSNFEHYKENPNSAPMPINENTSLADFEKFVKDAFQNYSKAHRELPSYNEPFWQAKEAAANIGDLNPDKAVQNLKRYLKVMDVPTESKLNAMSRAEKTPNNNELLRRLGPDLRPEILDNPVLNKILDWNKQKQFTPYINPHDEAISDIGKIKDVIQKKSPLTDYGGFKLVFDNDNKVVKKFMPDSYANDMLQEAIQEQLKFNKMGNLNPNTKTYKTSQNIWQTQDKYTPMNKLSNSVSDWENNEAMLNYLLKNKELQPSDLHPANYGEKADGTLKVFDTGTFGDIKNINNNDINELNKNFKTLPSDRVDYLNELLKLKLGK